MPPRAASPKRAPSPRAAWPKDSPKGSGSPRPAWPNKDSPKDSPRKAAGDSPKPKKKISPKKRPPKSGSTASAADYASGSEEYSERFGKSTDGVSRERAGSSGASVAALQEQLAESQRRQFEQHVALESMRELLEQAQLDNSRLTTRCALLSAKLGPDADDVGDGSTFSTERQPTGDGDEPEQRRPPVQAGEQVDEQAGLGLGEIARMLRAAPDPLPLDAAKVFNSLPLILQDAFDARSVDALDGALRAMPPYEAHYHMQRCVDSSLWEV